jgi:hypothetical protein
VDQEAGGRMNKDLYMTTQEFANLVASSIVEQGYFKANDLCHPEDLSNAFVMMSQTIGTTLCWGIARTNKNLSKNGDFD